MVLNVRIGYSKKIEFVMYEKSAGLSTV